MLAREFLGIRPSEMNQFVVLVTVNADQAGRARRIEYRRSEEGGARAI